MTRWKCPGVKKGVNGLGIERMHLRERADGSQRELPCVHVADVDAIEPQRAKARRPAHEQPR